MSSLCKHSVFYVCLWLLWGLMLPKPCPADEDKPPLQDRQTFHTEASKGKVIPNNKCLKCHGDEEEKTYELDDGKLVNIFVDTERFERSVHGQQLCTGCHTNVTKRQHEERLPIPVSCIQCHRQKWEEQKDNPDPQYKRLGVVMQQIDSYMHSVHARPRLDDQSRTNATCHNCHDAHYIGTLGSQARAEHRLKNYQVCGKCHEREKIDYLTSVHGKAVVEEKESESAVCSDCHTTHDIERPDANPTKLLITQNCGNCHQAEQKSYLNSYHGQVNRLGYSYTAKCYDCHGNHKIKRIQDPDSAVSGEHRLETCRKCHEKAPAGFLGYHPHGTTDDFQRYPEMWLASKLMNALIIVVFAFFWTHVILWFYREYRDRREGKRVQVAEVGTEQIYFQRFNRTWRVIHLLFAMSTMVLILTGTTLLFSHTAWATTVMGLLGGPKVEGIIHRSAASVWLSLFLFHLVLVTRNIIKKRGSFRWFGPTSMLPNLQDLRDVGAMFRWFFGKAPRPDFDRWAYWQKFDYWAPFWGVAVIGFSGLTLVFPTQIAHILPGYFFNIATIIHAEEALLAVMFLFTVHFFNAHFRPDKFPMNIGMFTGAMPIEEFQHEHRLEYARLQASGELEKYLVKRPTPGKEIGSRVLAAFLIFCGLSLLTLALFGYVTMR